MTFWVNRRQAGSNSAIGSPGLLPHRPLFARKRHDR
jgi:hypothetical protein